MEYDEKKNIKKKKRKKPKKHPVLYEIFDYARIVLFVVVAVLLVNNFLLINAQIPSESMENTIMVGDRIFGNRLAYKGEDKEPQRYDIVIFKYPDDESQLYIKRIIGLPGESVQISKGKVYVDGVELDDSFIAEPMDEAEELTFQVPEGCYFMMGDNRNHSWDSRYWNNHYVSEDEILGKAVLRYFPITEIGIVE